MRILSKISIIFLFLLSTFYLLPSVAHANTTPQPSNHPAPNTNPDVPNNLHNWTQNVMIEVMSSLTCQLAGIDPINPKQSCLGADTKTGKIGFLPSPQTGGAIGFMGNMISVLYTPPLHTTDYFRDLASNFGISKKTYAQTTGTGFQSLTPLIGIWSAFRNIVYLFLVIIFVVIGLAIMLRVKIDPRTVMTIQNQIPKIIIGILAVTFSFAIAGFLIDMMWVLIYLIYGIFNGIQGVDVSSLNPSSIQGQTALGVGGQINGSQGVEGIAGISSQVAGSVKDAILHLLAFDKSLSFTNLFADTISGIVSMLVGIQLAQIPSFSIFGFSIPLGAVGGAVSIPVVFTATKAAIVNGLPYLIVFLIVFIALLTALVRLWFALLMAYVQILLAVVLAPFWIIGGIVPGSPISLSGWLKDISANLLAFPVTIAMFMLGKVFMDAFGCDAKIQACKDALTHNFVPPLIGNPGDPSLIGSLIGLGILLMTPNVVNMLKQMLKAPKTDMMGAIGASLGAGAGIPSKALSTAGGIMTAARYDISGRRREDELGKGTGALGGIIQRFFR